RVSRVLVLACEGTMSLSAGLSRTSSNVRPVSIFMGATSALRGSIRGGPCKRGLWQSLVGCPPASLLASMGREEAGHGTDEPAHHQVLESLSDVRPEGRAEGADESGTRRGDRV